jgi:phosphopantothenoylcysteine synthetase/decarboxylase
MRIFVTAGNTQVLIDRVRCITNIFTGRTGGLIALEAHRRGHHVTLLTSHPEAVSLPASLERFLLMTYRTFEDLQSLLPECIARGQPDVIVHSAAVSDYLAAGVFAPAPGTHFDATTARWADARQAPAMIDRAAGKVKSDEPELWLRLVRAPKLVDQIRRDWNFRGLLVKFKLEVGIAEDALRKIAEASRQHSQADWMVANTLEGAADWALLGSAQGYRKIERERLPAALLDALEESHHG